MKKFLFSYTILVALAIMGLCFLRTGTISGDYWLQCFGAASAVCGIGFIGAISRDHYLSFHSATEG